MLISSSQPTRYKLASSLILFLSVIWIGLSATFPGGSDREAIVAPQEGFIAPDFSLVGLDGERITLSDFRGQPVLINIWASWCGPCRLEMPSMERIYQEYKDKGFIILAINTAYQDKLTDVETFIEEYHLSFPIILDKEGSLTKDYQLAALPSSYFVDSEGIIQEVVIGGPMAEALLRTRVEKLFKEGP